MSKIFIKFISIILVLIQTGIGYVFDYDAVQILDIDESVQYQTFEGFGTSTCWWAGSVDDPKLAENIAKALYSDEEGLGLEIVRYNIGGGELENPESRISDPIRKAESFYVYDEESGEYVYDFTRDANARRVLDYAIEYGAKEVILFCNSPHFSMTESGHASGSFKAYGSNLPKENYQAFVDYLLTIADWFVEQGYPVTYISPINEPQWAWGGDEVTQEGCHYSSDEATELLALFAENMKERNSPYKLSGPESGELSYKYMDYLFKFFGNETLNEYCDSFSGHSYWLDGSKIQKRLFGQVFESFYPDKTFEMSEWCELPMTIDVHSIDSGLYMANVLVEDLTLLNATAWSSWTAFHGDGLLYPQGSDVGYYNRWYAYKQFTSFIKPGMVRVDVNDVKGYQKDLEKVAFTDGENTVLVVVNNAKTEKTIELSDSYGKAEVYLTDGSHNYEKVSPEFTNGQYVLSPRSITTFVLSK